MSISVPNRPTNGAGAQHASEGLAQQALELIGKPGKLLIDGEWVAAESGRTFETFNPATEESLGSVAHGGAEDIDLAVRAARRCFDDERSDWRRMTPSRSSSCSMRLT